MAYSRSGVDSRWDAESIQANADGTSLFGAFDSLRPEDLIRMYSEGRRNFQGINLLRCELEKLGAANDYWPNGGGHGRYFAYRIASI